MGYVVITPNVSCNCYVKCQPFFLFVIQNYVKETNLPNLFWGPSKIRTYNLNVRSALLFRWAIEPYVVDIGFEPMASAL